MSVRRDTIDHIGLLDENFFLYFEDVDWCLRMRRAGWRLYFLSGAEVVHHVSKSAPDRAYAAEMLFKSMQYYLKKHFGKRRFKLLSVLFFANRVGIRFAKMLGRNLERSPKLVDERTIEIVNGGIEGDPLIAWPKLRGVDEYRLEISESSNFIIKGLMKTSRPQFRFPEFVIQEWPDGTYFWRVAPIEVEGCTGDFVIGAVEKRVRPGQ
jgi:hypothetical protein